MKQVITDIIESVANTEHYKIANLKTTIYLNERGEGFCDCCYKNFPPRALVRQSYTAGNRQMKYTIVSFLCARCSR